MNTRYVLAGLALIVSTSMASAQGAGQKLLGQFNDWSAYQATTDKGKLCFIISQPTKREPAGLNRDPAYFFITHRPGDNVRNEISVQVGFPLREGSTADTVVGSDKFSLITQNDRAWSNGQDDSKLVAAMRRGANVTVTSVSGRGNQTKDTYSLRGISAALDKINQECK